WIVAFEPYGDDSKTIRDALQPFAQATDNDKWKAAAGGDVAEARLTIADWKAGLPILTQWTASGGNGQRNNAIETSIPDWTISPDANTALSGRYAAAEVAGRNAVREVLVDALVRREPHFDLMSALRTGYAHFLRRFDATRRLRIDTKAIANI